MIKLKRLHGNNKLSGQKMAAAEPMYARFENRIRKAQYKYLKGSRAPTVLVPLKLYKKLAKWIRYNYKTAPKYLALDWIKSARDEHNLAVCPMCGGTAVATLDHVLPEANYPEFAVFSFNLVPSCDGCQRRRSNKGRSIQFIHPYFDHRLLDSLRLVVKFSAPYDAVGFSLVPMGLTGTDLTRARLHINESLPTLIFRRHMRRLWKEWHRLFHRGRGLARLIEDLPDSEADALNSWDVAFLRGLLSDSSVQAWMANNLPP